MSAAAAPATSGPAAAPALLASGSFSDLPRWLAERLFENAEDNAGGRPTQALVLEDRCV